MRGPLPAAVLWDYDGSLVDSESLWEEVERDMARELGGELPGDYHEYTIGGTIASTASYILRTVGSDADAGLVADELWARCKQALAGDAIRWMPGVEALVGALRAAGVPQALVSSGHRHYLDVTLDRLEPQPFSVVVAGDEVAHEKPHPEPYLRACAELGLDPGDCLAIEDSATGAASANAAGCAVLAVPSLGSMPDAPRRVLVDTLDGVDLVVLARLFQRASVG